MKYTLCMLLLISGCKPETTTESSDAVQTDTAAEAVPEIYDPIDGGPASEVTIAGGTFQLENDDIGGYPFEQDFETMLRSLDQAEIIKKPFQNIHDSTKTDTLIRVNFGPSAIEYYKIQADGSGFILEANIQSNELAFKKGIKIGMSQSDFFSLFEELQGKENLNTVIISTMEGLDQSVFIFDDGKLSTVKYESYFD